MRDEDKWPLMHRYRHAVSRNRALAICCPDCNDELVPIVGGDDLPALKCLFCRTVFTPGLHVWNQIRDAVADVPVHIDDYYPPKK